MYAMPKLGRSLGKRPNAMGAALTAWEIWRRIPPQHRKRLLAQARIHGPRIAKQAVAAGRKRRKSV
jgi:hypothetical protein